MEVNLNGSHTGLTLACLASQFCTELGSAQPQLVQWIFMVLRRKGLAKVVLDKFKKQYINRITFPVINKLLDQLSLTYVKPWLGDVQAT